MKFRQVSKRKWSADGGDFTIECESVWGEVFFRAEAYDGQMDTFHTLDAAQHWLEHDYEGLHGAPL